MYKSVDNGILLIRLKKPNYQNVKRHLSHFLIVQLNEKGAEKNSKGRIITSQSNILTFILFPNFLTWYFLFLEKKVLASSKNGFQSRMIGSFRSRIF